MKQQNFLWKLGCVLAVLVFMFGIYNHFHKQYIEGRIATNIALYDACIKAQANEDSLTDEEKSNCDSLHKLVMENEGKH